MSVMETNSLIEELKNLNNDLSGGLKDAKSSTISFNTASANKFNSTSPVLSSSVPSVSAIPLPPVKKPLTEDEISDFILQKSEELIMNGLDTVRDLQQTIVNTLDAKAMQGYANIMGATTAAIDTLNAINIEKRKQKAAKELKELDIAAKKAIGPANNTKNVVNLIANRETVLKMLEEASGIPIKGEVIDLKPDDYSIKEE